MLPKNYRPECRTRPKAQDIVARAAFGFSVYDPKLQTVDCC